MKLIDFNPNSSNFLIEKIRKELNDEYKFHLIDELLRNAINYFYLFLSISSDTFNASETLDSRIGRMEIEIFRFFPDIIENEKKEIVIKKLVSNYIESILIEYYHVNLTYSEANFYNFIHERLRWKIKAGKKANIYFIFNYELERIINFLNIQSIFRSLVLIKESLITSTLTKIIHEFK